MNRDEPMAEPSPNASSPRGEQIESLFRQHNESLLRFLLARTGSAQEARDVAQEAYVKLLNLDRPDTVGYLRAYLFQTAANLVKDRQKQRSRRERIDPLVFFEEASDAASPELLWDARQRLGLISQALQGLSPRCRAAFILRKFDELSVEQIAVRLQVDERSVKRYLARALEHCERFVSAAEHAPSRESK